MRRPLALLAALALAGCASMSEQECRSGDWEAVGRADGARGARPEQIDHLRKVCARHGVEPQAEAWRAGYAKGIESYCTPAGGYVSGRSATGYSKVCAGRPEEAKFLAAFRHGQEVSALRREVRELHQRVRDLEMAAMSGEYSDYEATQIRLRATELAGTLRIRQWELEKLDRRYSLDHAAPELTDAELP